MATAGISRICRSILLTITIFSFSLPAYAKYDGGTGEPNDPYQIATAEDLMLLGETPEDYDKHFILTADIDLDPNLPGRKVFDKAVIAPDTNPNDSWPEFQGTRFTGVFDGNDYTISHLTIRGKNCLGLFGEIYGAAIFDLGLEAVDVNGTGNYIGGLVGYNCWNGIITKSYSNGTVTGIGYVGGLVGLNWWSGIIIRSHSTGMVSGDWVYIGGLVGLNHGDITNSYSAGKVSGDKDVGGLVGDNGGSITSSFWDMQTSEQTTSAGGIGKTTVQMQDINTYLNAGWDFADETLNGTCDFWQISPGEYPKLHFAGDSPAMPEGLGTAEQPYLIRDAGDLGTVSFEPTAHYRLEASIDLSGITWSTAVIPWFGGSFDGNGYTISNLHIHGGRYLGLVGQLRNGATISNLGLAAADINGKDNYVGGFVGYNWGGSISNCYSTGSISGNNEVVGGVVGFNKEGNITNSTITGYGYVGGLVGYNREGRITNSYNNDTISGNNCVGGLVGENWEGNIIACYSTGPVSGDGKVGGLVGYNSGSITSSYNKGRVTDNGNGAVGGLVGFLYTGGSITNSYSSGSVNSTGSVSGYGKVGGLVGNSGGRTTLSFWNTQTSGQTTSAGGKGLTSAQMRDINTYLKAGWDFADETLNGTCDYWQISPSGYPELRFVGDSPAMPEGLGTAEQPYLIRDARDLGTVWFEPAAHYRLVASIDLSGITSSTAVIPWFGGSFDGNGYTISHLHIQGGGYVGLFGRLESEAVVSNLGLEGMDVNGTGYYVGGLVGYNSGNVTNNYSIGIVSGDYNADQKDIGGLVGYNDGNITNCYSAGMIREGYLFDNTGGLVGTNEGSILGSFSTAMVNGGISVGGLVGENEGSIINCCCNGTVKGESSVGGLVGRNHEGSIFNCYSTSRVSASWISEYYTGIFGGLVAYNDGSITSSFWDMQTSEQTTSAGGEGLTTVQMQDINTYLNAGWDFADESLNGTCDCWQISPGKYPKLRFASDRLAMPEGMGTAVQPYLIRDAGDLKTVWFEPAAHYRLEASIDLSGITWSTAVIPCFGGYFDGNGHTISNLHIQGGNYLGLFGLLESEAVIFNLGLEEMDVNGMGYYVGGLVGNNNKGNIFNCYGAGTVTGDRHVGGLVGYNYGIISNCYRTGTAKGNYDIGGCVGTNIGDVTNCYSAVRVGEDGQMSIVVAYSYMLTYTTGCFWDSEIGGFPSGHIRMGLSTAEMQTASTFLEAGWDFVGETANGTEDIWWINEGQDYPRLWWERAEE